VAFIYETDKKKSKNKSQLCISILKYINIYALPVQYHPGQCFWHSSLVKHVSTAGAAFTPNFLFSSIGGAHLHFLLSGHGIHFAEFLSHIQYFVDLNQPPAKCPIKIVVPAENIKKNKIVKIENIII